MQSCGTISLIRQWAQVNSFKGTTEDGVEGKISFLEIMNTFFRCFASFLENGSYVLFNIYVDGVNL